MRRRIQAEGCSYLRNADSNLVIEQMTVAAAHLWLGALPVREQRKRYRQMLREFLSRNDLSKVFRTRVRKTRVRKRSVPKKRGHCQ